MNGTEARTGKGGASLGSSESVCGWGAGAREVSKCWTTATRALELNEVSRGRLMLSVICRAGARRFNGRVEVAIEQVS